MGLISRHCLILSLRNALPTFPPRLRDTSDTYHWITYPQTPTPIHSSKGNSFNFHQKWLAINTIGPVVPWFGDVWFARHIPKHAFTVRVVAWNRLPTRDRLLLWNYTGPPNCLLCNVADESHVHLFFQCTFNTTLWTHFTQKVNLSPPSPLADTLQWISSATIPCDLRLIFKLLIQAIIYEIWTERNRRLHHSETRQCATLLSSVRITVTNRIAFLSRFSTNIQRNSSRDSLLQTCMGSYLQTHMASS